jgi:hypothetical protein
MIPGLMAIISLNSTNQLIFVMVKCGVLFEFLNIIKMSFVFKGLAARLSIPANNFLRTM